MSAPVRLPAIPAIVAALALAALAVWLSPRITASEGLTWTPAAVHAPRALLGALAGMGLAIAGVVLQATLKNPLADPYTLGISSGAAVGAAVVVQLGSFVSLALPATFVGALVGALGAAALVYVIASRKELAAETLLLAGVAMALFGGAIISVLHFVADTIDLFAMLRWSMGSLATGPSWHRVQLVAPFVGVGVVACLLLGRQLEVAALDDESARGLGVDPVRTRRLAFVGTSILTAGIVAVAGPIGFIGLVVPHAVRGLVGPDPRVVLPCSAFLGAALLVACDVLARTLVYPTELPISVITHAFGCPAFVWILVRRR